MINRVHVPQPRIYACAEWGARPPAGPISPSTPTGYVVHHTAGPNTPLISDPKKALAEAFELARSIQYLHQQVEGWLDTGNNFLVTRNGIILEGRHGSIAAIAAGRCVDSAHCPGMNQSPGTEHEGLYDTQVMPGAQWAAAVRLCAWVLYVLKLDTTTIKGHRDYYPTDCPGGWFYSQLPRFRHEVHEMLEGGKP